MLLERVMPGLHPLVVGIHLQTRRNPVHEAADQEPGLAAIPLGFRVHLSRPLADLLKGRGLHRVPNPAR